MSLLSETSHPTKDNDLESMFLEKSELKIKQNLRGVLEKFAEMGYLEDFANFFELANNGIYPLECIPLPAWLDSVRWYGCDSASKMRYRDVMKVFWRVVYKELHAGGYNLLTGIKFDGCLVTNQSDQQNLIPAQTQINWAGPSIQNLKAEHEFIKKCSNPGIITEVISKTNVASVETQIMVNSNALKEFSIVLIAVKVQIIALQFVP